MTRIGPDRIPLFHAVPTKWHWVVWHPENLTMGQNVDIGAFTAIFAHHGVTIEDNVQIGSHCSIYSLNTINNTKGAVYIRKGACIGSHCVILPGVTIGPGVLVKAMSVVKASKIIVGDAHD